MIRIYHIARKNILLRFSSRSFFIFFLLLPILFTVVLSGTLAGVDDPRQPLLLTLEEETPLTANLVAELAAVPTLELVHLPMAEAAQALADKEAVVWLIIPAGTTTAVAVGQPIALPLRKLPNNSDADALERTVTAVVSRASLSLSVAHNSVQAAEIIEPFPDEAARTAYFATAQQAAPPLCSRKSASPGKLPTSPPASSSLTPRPLTAKPPPTEIMRSNRRGNWYRGLLSPYWAHQCCL